MYSPVGPLPAAVYWRRRVGALSVLVVVLVLGVWGLTAVGGGRGAVDDERAAAAPPAGASSAAPSSTPPPSPPPSTSPPPGSAAPGTTSTPRSAAVGPGPAAVPAPTSPVAPWVIPGAALPGAPAALPTPPGGCPDPVLLVQAQPAAPLFPVGSEPEFRLLVTNTGPVACAVDVNTAWQEVLVYLADGVTRLWSSNDCYGGGSADVRTLAPGQQLVFPVAWSGLTSAPGCVGERMPVLGGEFRLVVRLGALVSAPVPFTLA